MVYYSNIHFCARLSSFVPIDISHNGMGFVKITVLQVVEAFAVQTAGVL
jgi:hypothetical protein